MKRWSLDARSEGQSSHPLGSEQFAHEWEGDEQDRTSHGANLTAHSFYPLRKVLVRRAQGGAIWLPACSRTIYGGGVMPICIRRRDKPLDRQ